jgi:hypothetical protein
MRSSVWAGSFPTMCATCVAQGVAYVGGALGGLQVMAARARSRRSRSAPPSGPDPGSTSADGQPPDSLEPQATASPS